MGALLILALGSAPIVATVPSAEDAALAQRLTLYTDQNYDMRTGRAQISILRVYQGSSRAPLAPEIFYELVHRPDLAQAYRLNMREKLGLVVSGFSLVGVGIGLMLGAVVNPSFHGHAAWTMGIAGGSFFTFGWGMAKTGAEVFPHPVDAPQARALVEAYNAGLPAPVTQRAAPMRRWAVAPWIGPGSGGLAAQLSF